MDKRYITLRIPVCDGYKTLAFNTLMLVFGVMALTMAMLGEAVFYLHTNGCVLIILISLFNLGLRVATDRASALAWPGKPDRVRATSCLNSITSTHANDFRNFSSSHASDPAGIPATGQANQNFPDYDPYHSNADMENFDPQASAAAYTSQQFADALDGALRETQEEFLARFPTRQIVSFKAPRVKGEPAQRSTGVKGGTGEPAREHLKASQLPKDADLSASGHAGEDSDIPEGGIQEGLRRDTR